MMHKAWCYVGRVPYNFSRSFIKFQGHTGWKINHLNPISVRLLGPSQLSNPSDLPCSTSSVKFQGHMGQKIDNFDPNWVFPDCNSSLISLMDLKWCIKLDVEKKRCPIIFGVIHQISRSHGLKNRRFESNLSKIGRSQLSNPSDLHCCINVRYMNHTEFPVQYIWCNIKC